MEARLPRQDILARLDDAYRQFHDALAAVKPEQMEQSGVVGFWSVKDLLAHLIFWNQFPVQELQAALVGVTVAHPDGSGDEINAWAVSFYCDQPADAVREAFEQSYRDLLTCIKALPDSAFDAGSAVEQVLGETVHGALGNNTYEHWPVHEAQLRAWSAASG